MVMVERVGTFMKHQFLLIMLVLILGVTSTVGAQDCPAFITAAMQRAGESCAGMGRDQACYGNPSMTARLTPGISELAFNNIGDLTPVATIEHLKLNPLNTISGDWGVALMRVQADIPQSANPENVTLLLFGDAEIEQAASDVYHPMQAFYLQTGASTDGCGEIPSSGLLIQTPEGVGKVSLWINEVQVKIGSTVLFQAEAGGDMSISTFEGSAEVTVNGETQEAVAGTFVRVPLDADLRPTGVPTPPEAITLDFTVAESSPLVELTTAATTGAINEYYVDGSPINPSLTTPGLANEGDADSQDDSPIFTSNAGDDGCNNENGQGNDNGNCFGHNNDNGNNGNGNNGNGNNGNGNNGNGNGNNGNGNNGNGGGESSSRFCILFLCLG